MSQPSDIAAHAVGFRLLVRLKLTILRNLLVHAAREGPLKLAVSVTFLAAIWVGLFALFVLIFESFQTSPLEAAVVIPVIFNVFFVALLVLLCLSNAVIAYGFFSTRLRCSQQVLLIELDTRVFQEPSVLILKRLPPMVLLLQLDILDEPIFVRDRVCERAISLLPVREAREYAVFSNPT